MAASSSSRLEALHYKGKALTKKTRPQAVRPPAAPVAPARKHCGFRLPPEGQARAGAWPEEAAPWPLRAQVLAWPRRSSRTMWPSTEVPRAEPRPEAGPHRGGSRRSSELVKIQAQAPTVNREHRSHRRSSPVPVPGSPKEVGGRVGTMARPGMERWCDRLALVTGASGGIGAAVARALVQQGLKVVGCARTVGNIEVRLCWTAGTLWEMSFPLSRALSGGGGVAGTRL